MKTRILFLVVALTLAALPVQAQNVPGKAPAEKVYIDARMTSQRYVTILSDTLYGHYFVSDELGIFNPLAEYTGRPGSRIFKGLVGWPFDIEGNRVGSWTENTCYHDDFLDPPFGFNPYAVQYTEGNCIALFWKGWMIYVSPGSPSRPPDGGGFFRDAGYMQVFMDIYNGESKTPEDFGAPATQETWRAWEHFKAHAKLVVDGEVYRFRDADHERCAVWTPKGFGEELLVSCWPVAENPFLPLPERSDYSTEEEFLAATEPYEQVTIQIIAPVDLRYSTPTATEADNLPESVRLAQNYPNPFNPATAITYELASPGPVRLEVFDATVRSVAVLVDGVQPAGRHSVHFDASGLPSGLYVYRLQAGGAALAKKMTLIR